MKNIPGYLLIYLIKALSRLSWNALYRLSDGVRWIVFDVFRYRNKVITENLRRSFPEKTEAELARIRHDFQQNLTDILVESIKLPRMTKAELGQRLTGDMSMLEDYYREGKNVVVVLGHLGNWELGNLYASSHFSHQLLVVYHPLTNELMENYITRVRTRFGSQMIPMRQAYARTQPTTGKPFLFFLVNDQSPNPHKAYWTTFLHQDTGMFRGVEIIARQYNCPVVYAKIERDESRRGHYRVVLDLITDSPAGMPSNGILEMQARLLEADIRRQPANWLWSHKRWKHPRPAHLEPFQLLESPLPRESKAH